MELRVLGPVELRVDDLVLGSGTRPQQLVVLAALAVDAGRLVPTEVLVDRVWGEQPPPRARRTLHTHITRIRHLLVQAGTAGGQPAHLVRRTGGYLLDLDTDRVDLHRFRRLVAESHDAVALHGALALWRGEPLTGLPGEWAARMREAWRQQWLDAVVAWARAELTADNHHAVLGPLTELVDQYPSVEPLAAALIRAIRAAGRDAEALQRYQTIRQRLADQLGVDPGDELRGLYEDILRADRQRAAAPGRRPAAVPAQLPLSVPGFTGRAGELAQLDKILAEASTAVVISALSGTAGVGKTSLGVHWAHRVADLFPDGQLYVDLRGYHPSGSAIEPGEAARGFLDALGIAPQRIPMDLAQQTALYRGLLADKRILVVLDNAYDADQVRPLLPGAPGCFVLVTSRNQLSGLTAAEGAHPLVLDRFTPDEAREFLARRLDRDRVTAEPEAVEEIVTGCARLPLALAIVAARAATHPDFALAALAADLRRAGSGLDAFAGDPTTDVRAVFSWSYRVLSDQAARLFRLLGLHPSPDIAPPAATSLAGLPERQARLLLTELTRAHLLTEHTPGRYTIHDLLRAYATELTDIHDSAPDRRAALHRLFDHYLRAAHAANGLVYPARYPVTPPPAQPGVSLPDLGTRQEAVAWLVTEQPVLLAALHRAARDGFDVHAWQIAWSLQWFLDASGQTRIIVTVFQIALAAARRLVDPTGQALALRGLGFGWLTLGRYDQADRCMRESRALFRTVGDRVGEARAEVSIGMVCERQEHYHDAARHIRRALTLLRDSGDLAGQARALNNLAWLHARLEDHPAAVANAQRAIQASQEIGDPVNEATSWHTLGYSHHQAGRHAEAVPSYQRSLELCRNQGMPRYEAQALVSLADSHRAAGDAAAAQRALEEALDILDELDDPDAEQVRAQLATDPEA